MPISGSSPRWWQWTEAETRRGSGTGGQGPSWVAGGEAGQRWRNREAVTTSMEEEGRRWWREVLVGGGEAAVKEATMTALLRQEGAKAEGEKREGTEEQRWGLRATSFEAMEVLADADITHKRMLGRQRKSSKEEREREREKVIAVSTTTEEGANGGGEGEKAPTVGDAEAERERSDVERT